MPLPEDAYDNAPDLVADMEAKRLEVRSFRITGRVDHFGEENRIQGKVLLMASMPDNLRIEVISPFGSPLNVLTVSQGRFALYDLREGRFMEGPAEPCNIARLVRIPLPSDQVIRVLTGYTPIIDGGQDSAWNDKGFYDVFIRERGREQHLQVGPDRNVLPLLKSVLKDKEGAVFDIAFDRWSKFKGIAVPTEIHVKMPRNKADLLLRYDSQGVELNLDLPEDAWTQPRPPGIKVEQVSCEEQIRESEL